MAILFFGSLDNGVLASDTDWPTQDEVVFECQVQEEQNAEFDRPVTSNLYSFPDEKMLCKSSANSSAFASSQKGARGVCKTWLQRQVRQPCLTGKISREMGLNIKCNASWRILLLRRTCQ